MTLDHRVAQCRDPMKCWKCNTFGHISSSCGSSRRHGGLASHATHSQTRAFHSASRVLASVPSLNSTPEKKSFVDVLLSPLPPPHTHTPPTPNHTHPKELTGMECHYSFGRGPQPQQRRMEPHHAERGAVTRGCAVNYPGNPASALDLPSSCWPPMTTCIRGRS
jgi:hypothetical protein